ncbi:zf-HC2 domain-containing protein [Mycobacterium sp. shizuoka-1]|uniref:zf-HC2 domain-containing protein n=1 Tax=Mycobacterium sp. shizuoka-1 TaxID=2039281 RepID=UPI000C06C50A|nr:zf-HC2 domain-containing protein [Mycobacterium sp. shizuoka-1]
MAPCDGPAPSSRDTHPYAMWDAAYVLGALSYPERREFEAHLRVCPPCAAAVSGLGGIPALLSTIDRDYIDAIDVRAPAAMSVPRAELLARVALRRRRSRALTATLASAAVVAIGVGVGVHSDAIMLRPMLQRASTVTLLPMRPVSLSATVTLTPRAWGTRIDMNCAYALGGAGSGDADATDATLAMVAVGRDGSHVQVATWTAHTGVPAVLGGSTSMPMDQIAAVQVVTAGAGAVLLERSL